MFLRGGDFIFSNVINSAILAAEKSCFSDFSGCELDNTGLFVCPVCGKRKQTRVRGRIIPCQCGCDIAAEKEARQKRALEERISRNIEKGVTDRRYLSQTFEVDRNFNPEISNRCRKYVENWQAVKERNIGLLLYGNTGTGKTFFSCCIGNALLQTGVRVLITSLPRLVQDRIESVKIGKSPVNLKAFELLILDDFGCGNINQTIYQIIDDIYVSQIPLIVTTNLSPKQLTEPNTMEEKRIFDRVLEMCAARILVNGTPLRREIARQKAEFVEQLFKD